MLFVCQSVVTLSCPCPLHISWTLWSIFMKLHWFVPLSKTLCRAHCSATWKFEGFTLEFPISSKSPEPFDWFLWYFTHIFLLVKRCAEHMILHSYIPLSKTVCRAHNPATKIQGQRSRAKDLPLNFVSAPYLLNPLIDFYETLIIYSS